MQRKLQSEDHDRRDRRHQQSLDMQERLFERLFGIMEKSFQKPQASSDDDKSSNDSDDAPITNISKRARPTAPTKPAKRGRGGRGSTSNRKW